MVPLRSLQAPSLPERPAQRHTTPRFMLYLICVSLLVAGRGGAFVENPPPPIPPFFHVHDAYRRQPRAVTTVIRGDSSNHSGGSSHGSGCRSRQRPRWGPPIHLLTRPAFLAGAASGSCSHTHKNNNDGRRICTTDGGGIVTIPPKRSQHNIKTFKSVKHRKNKIEAFSIPAHVGSAPRTPSPSDGVGAGGGEEEEGGIDTAVVGGTDPLTVELGKEGLVVCRVINGLCQVGRCVAVEDLLMCCMIQNSYLVHSSI